MPSSAQHAEGANVAYLLTKFFVDLPRRVQSEGVNFSFGKFAAEGVVEWIGVQLGAALPDVFEPADHPHHRGGFHSYEVLLGTGYGWWTGLEWDLHPVPRAFLRGTSFGYGHHLAMDATTPMGLPSIVFG